MLCIILSQLSTSWRLLIPTLKQKMFGFLMALIITSLWTQNKFYHAVEKKCET